MLQVVIVGLLTNESVTEHSVHDVIPLLDVALGTFSVRFHLACFGPLLLFAKMTLNLVPVLLSENKNNRSQLCVSHQVCMCREPLSNSSMTSILLFPQTSYTSKATVIKSK